MLDERHHRASASATGSPTATSSAIDRAAPSRVSARVRDERRRSSIASATASARRSRARLARAVRRGLAGRARRRAVAGSLGADRRGRRRRAGCAGSCSMPRAARHAGSAGGWSASCSTRRARPGCARLELETFSALDRGRADLPRRRLPRHLRARRATTGARRSSTSTTSCGWAEAVTPRGAVIRTMPACPPAAPGSCCTARATVRSRCCSSIPAARSGPGATPARGRSRRASTTDGEDPLAAARREFEEELGSAAARRRGARPRRGPAEVGQARARVGARGRPRRRARSPATRSSSSGRRGPGGAIEIPEVDRAEWFGLERRAREDQPGPGRAARPAERAARMSGSDAISPTAHYTGYVWARNGLSHPALETPEGRRAVRVAAAGDRRQPDARRQLARVVSAHAPPGDRRAARAGDRGARRSAR